MTKVRDAEQVIDAAARVFAAKGFEDARLKEIAGELGILTGSLYYHAPTKAELFTLVFERRLRVLIERVERIAASDAAPLEKFEAALRAHLSHLDEFYPESSHWFLPPARTSPRRHVAVGPRYHQYEEILRGILQEGIVAGEIRNDIDPKIVTLGVLGACNWVTRWYRKGGRLSIAEIGDTLVPLLTDGIRAGAPHSRRRRSARPRAV